GDQFGGAVGGAGRRVHLLRVVRLDDLDGLEERRRLLREVHHQHRADAEVGGDEDVARRVVGQPGADRVDAGRVEAGGADHDVQAALDAPLDVVHHDAGLGEVDDDLRGGQRLER